MRSTRDRLIPYCAFIDPELARVGLDETTAQQQRIAVRVARIPMTSVLRARAIGETRGFMKMLLDADSDRILGFTMLGADAGEVLAVVQTAMLAGLPYTGLRDAILTHPTMAEGLNVLLTSVPPDASARMAARALARWEGEGGRVTTAKNGQGRGDHMSNYKVGYFVGSLSTSSINRLLAKALVRLAPAELDMTEIPLKDLPLYNRDYDDDYPPVATAFKDAIAAVDAVLFVTPEYNRSIPGALKNAIDWASRPYGKNSFARKPSAVIGTSPGKIGTAIGQQHLRSILGFCNSPQMNAVEAYIQFEPGLITDDGEVTNDDDGGIPAELHDGVPRVHHEGLYGPAQERVARTPRSDHAHGRRAARRWRPIPRERMIEVRVAELRQICD